MAERTTDQTIACSEEYTPSVRDRSRVLSSDDCDEALGSDLTLTETTHREHYTYPSPPRQLYSGQLENNTPYPSKQSSRMKRETHSYSQRSRVEKPSLPRPRPVRQPSIQTLLWCQASVQAKISAAYQRHKNKDDSHCQFRREDIRSNAAGSQTPHRPAPSTIRNAAIFIYTRSHACCPSAIIATTECASSHFHCNTEQRHDRTQRVKSREQHEA